jgi:restriction system protein
MVGMARQDQKNRVTRFHLLMPWWLFVPLGVACFYLLQWYVPENFSGNPVYVLPVVFGVLMAWPSLLLFLLLALVAWSADRKKSQPQTNEPTDHNDPPPPQMEVVEPDAADRIEPSMEPAPEPGETATQDWNLNVLRKLEWKRFEALCVKYYEAVGFKSKVTRRGADGGIEVKLYKHEAEQPIAIVRCKAWDNTVIDTKEIQELMAVMKYEKVTRGVFITTGRYTDAAQSLATSKPLQLLDGPGLLRKIVKLPEERQQKLLRYALRGGYDTPTCPACGTKMTRQVGRSGNFWGCISFPVCRQTFAMS